MRRQIVKRLLLAAIAAGSLTTVHAIATDNPEHVKQLKETRKCSGCDLQNASLEGVNVIDGDLSYADARGAQLYKAELRGANLTGALFTGANLKGADLRDTKGADLVGAVTDEWTKCPNGSAGPCQ